MKEAMNLYFNHEHRRGRLMFTVHDQMIVSCPKSRIKTEVKIIEQCMANALKDYLDVPLAVNIEIGSSYAEV
jgi:DNA polymerase I-like protein with 3'-5' exonuclease and polymerase domains